MKKCSFFMYCLLLAVSANAQLCMGSLGDPTVHITFGNSSTPRIPLKPDVTGMNYVETCPNDGSYTITGTLAGCFSNSWFEISADHTGDSGGRAMLINASFTPSDFFVDTVRGLCGNTVYEFATWTANVLKSSSCNNAGILPNLSFRIETITGELLQQFSSGDIAATNSIHWQQFGTFFSTPSNTSDVVLRIRNNSKGGCGNDLMLDDITFRPCGSKISAFPANSTNTDTTVCGDQQSDITLNTDFSAPIRDQVLQWQLSKDSGKTWVDISGEQGINFVRKPTAVGFYQYRVAITERANTGSVNCRVASNVVTIHVPSLPTTSFTMVPACEGAKAAIQASQGIGYSYQWLGSNGGWSTSSDIVFPSVQFTDSGLYKVVISVLGCGVENSFYMRVHPNAKAMVSGETGICEGRGAMLHASGGNRYAWLPATSLSDAAIENPVASPSDTTNYTVIVTNEHGCVDSAFTAVNVWKKPTANAGSDIQIFEGDPAYLQGAVLGTSIRYHWLAVAGIQNSNRLSPVVYPREATTYTLTAVSSLGCGVAADDVTVKVYKSIMPSNVFSPNGDGINDSWIISGLETYPASAVSVYSRTGQLLFRTRSVNKIWDGRYNGRAVPVGVYYYLIDLAIGRPPLSGWVLVVR